MCISVLVGCGLSLLCCPEGALCCSPWRRRWVAMCIRVLVRCRLRWLCCPEDALLFAMEAQEGRHVY